MFYVFSVIRSKVAILGPFQNEKAAEEAANGLWQELYKVADEATEATGDAVVLIYEKKS